MFKIYDESKSPSKGPASLRYAVNRTRHMRARVQDIFMVSRNRNTRRGASETW